MQFMQKPKQPPLQEAVSSTCAVANKLENGLFYVSSLISLPTTNLKVLPSRGTGKSREWEHWGTCPQRDQCIFRAPTAMAFRVAFWSYLFSDFALVSLGLGDRQTLEPSLVPDAGVTG